MRRRHFLVASALALVCRPAQAAPGGGWIMVSGPGPVELRLPEGRALTWRSHGARPEFLQRDGAVVMRVTWPADRTPGPVEISVA